MSEMSFDELVAKCKSFGVVLIRPRGLRRNFLLAKGGCTVCLGTSWEEARRRIGESLQILFKKYDLPSPKSKALGTAYTPMDILKMKVKAFKDVLDSKKTTQKKRAVSLAFAEEFNLLIEEAKKAEPAMAEHFPQFIKLIDQGSGKRRVEKVDYIHIEIKVKHIIGVIRLFDPRS